MKGAAGKLEFEEAARLRDELERLQTVELAVGDDPLARQAEINSLGGGSAGERPFGRAANNAREPRAQADRRRHGAAQLGRRRGAAEGGRRREVEEPEVGARRISLDELQLRERFRLWKFCPATRIPGTF